MSGEGAQPSGTEGPKEPGAKTFDDVLANYATLEKAVHDAIEQLKLQTAASSPPSKWDRFNQFTSSGLFFMIVGAGFLLVAAITLNTAHASFSFVLVVIGVAVLLFGTGTQGVGEAQATGYKVAIAGGAGVIAFCVGWGIIHYADSIKTVFQIEKKYIRVVLVGGDGSSNLSSYVATFSIDGVAIPSAKYEDFVEVFVPYFASDWRKGRITATSLADSTTKLLRGCPNSETNTPDSMAPIGRNANEDEYVIKTVRASFYRVEANSALRDKLLDLVTVRLRRSAMGSQDSGFDFPLYRDTVCVYLVSERKAAADLEASRKAADIKLPSENLSSRGRSPSSRPSNRNDRFREAPGDSGLSRGR